MKLNAYDWIFFATIAFIIGLPVLAATVLK